MTQTDSDDEGVAPAKRQKMDPKAKNKIGAAVYKTKFQSSWKSKYPFLSPVAHNTSSFHCSVCAIRTFLVCTKESMML